jgi:hypothetical protein
MNILINVIINQVMIICKLKRKDVSVWNCARLPFVTISTIQYNATEDLLNRNGFPLCNRCLSSPPLKLNSECRQIFVAMGFYVALVDSSTRCCLGVGFSFRVFWRVSVMRDFGINVKFEGEQRRFMVGWKPGVWFQEVVALTMKAKSEMSPKY